MGMLSNMPIAVFVAFKHNVGNPSFTVNDHKYISHINDTAAPANNVKILELQLRLNNQQYPNDKVEIDSPVQDIHRAYEMYENMCAQFGVFPQFNKNDFQTIYPIFCFDLSAQDENLAKNGVALQLYIKKSSNVPLTAYALILEQHTHIVQVNGGNKMTRVN